MHNQLLDMLIKKDEIRWQTIIYDLIKSEEMNPWDIDISLLSKKYIETIKKLQESDFFISGKVILASALLLRIKSHKLVTEDISALDSLLYPQEDEEHQELEDYNDKVNVEIPNLAIKTPQARKRKISVEDLIGSLQKALEVNKRRIVRRILEKNVDIKIPEKKIDITKLIRDIYQKILNFFKSKETITFNELVLSEKKDDKLLTLLPLLHLDHQEKINIDQKEHFGEIYINRYK
tara:strand:+ start:27142 stop:27846 length:705 start_codon:yes stop_codon:yes gene_type:complete